MFVVRRLLVVILCLIVSGTVKVTAGQDGDLDDVTSVTWVISQDICTLSDCSCSYLNGSHTLVNCACSEENQIVNLERGENPGRHFLPVTSLIFKIQNCSRLRVHPHAFAPAKGPHFDLDLTNIRDLEVMESAFELNPDILSRNIVFRNVTIDTLPPKSFPSSLNILKFLNSKIRAISPLAFKGKTLQELLFANSRISLIESRAFDEEILINNSWIVDNCRIALIESQGIAASITNMTWQRSTLGSLQAFSFAGTILSATFVQNTFQEVMTNGLTLRDWTALTFRNNSFEKVTAGGIDLAQHSPLINTALFSGNTWFEVGTDFVRVGHQSSAPFTLISDNVIRQPCNCSPLFVPQVTLNGSSAWFQEQVWNNSMCLTTPKGSACLGRADSSRTLISYSEWPELCSEATFLCVNELREVSDDDEVLSSPPLAGKLRILAIFIGTVAMAIVLALLTVLCVYICRRDKGRPEKVELGRPMTSRQQSQCNGAAVNGHSYNGLFANAKMPISASSLQLNSHLPVSATKGPLVRPHSTFFEDVSMEDKGVQTLPSDLSSDVLEGLKERLTDPESFWDAKETIDHLYDLIQVTSPPDVTVMSPKVNGCPPKVKPPQRSTATTTHSPPVRSSSLVPPDNQSAIPAPRYAQIRSKPTRSPAMRHFPSSDIYAELSQQKVNDPEVNHGVNDLRPRMCDYTEPQDAQAHVYAELSSFPNAPVTFNPNHHNKTFCVQRPRPIGRLTTPPTVPPFGPSSDVSGGPSSCQQRPLPSIPPPFSTLK